MSYDKIRYEDLVRDYEASLTTTLRGFRPDIAFAETWVPDDDPTKSILNLIEASEGCSLPEFELFVGATTRQRLDIEKLRVLSAPVAKVSVREEEGGTVLRVVMGSADPLDEVSLPYRAGLSLYLGKSNYRRKKADLVAGHWTRVEREGVVLAAVMDAAHVIREIGYDGSLDEVEVAVLEALCESVVGSPLQEASDHAVVKLEARLRDHDATPPVAGIVMPGNADPIFLLPTSLVRALYLQYRESKGLGRGENNFIAPPHAAWIALSPTEQVSKVREALARSGLGFGLKAEDLEVISIEGGIRVTVRFAAHVPGGTQSALMMRLERRLAAEVEPRLQLGLEERKDKNLNRRL